MRDHLEGLSFRALSRKYGLSIGNCHNKVIRELENLPHVADITREYCTKFSRILLVDGTYIGINSYDRKIPVIYGIDYLTHDIPTFKLARSESYQACREFFVSCNLNGYPLSILVCDDNRNIYEGCRGVYTNAPHQLCHNHFKESIKLSLGLNTLDKTHQEFYLDLKTILGIKRSNEDFNNRASKLLSKYSYCDKYTSILLNINQRQNELTAYHLFRGTPITTNLIESYNKQLKARLKSICYFEDFHHAKLWLNAYFLYRRVKKFTDCKSPFFRLNGHCSLEITLSKQHSLPKLF